jgi:hypothetical protein
MEMARTDIKGLRVQDLAVLIRVCCDARSRWRVGSGARFEHYRYIH